MDKELKQHLQAMEARLASKDDLDRVETALLTEFHKWASPAELRAKSNALATRALDQEMELLKERVEKLEGKKASENARKMNSAPAANAPHIGGLNRLARFELTGPPGIQEFPEAAAPASSDRCFDARSR